MGDVLPDVLERELRVVFCGTAPGAASAKAGAYYAGHGSDLARAGSMFRPIRA